MNQQIERFFRYMNERELIRLRREAGQPRDSWTTDEVLSRYKFTNIKRAHDRTTRRLHEELFDKGDQNSEFRAEEVLLNCTIFRYFGTVEMALDIGWITIGDHEDGGVIMIERLKHHLIDTARARFAARKQVFTGAYIIPNCGDLRPKHEVVADIVAAVWDEIPEAINLGYRANSWRILCERLCRARGVGSFMAKEIALDFIQAMKWTPTDWTTWTPIGPGARRGASRIEQSGHVVRLLSERSALAVCQALYAQSKNFWIGPIDDGEVAYERVSLDLTDIQFALCEFDKYLRAWIDGKTLKNLFTPHDQK